MVNKGITKVKRGIKIITYYYRVVGVLFLSTPLSIPLLRGTLNIIKVRNYKE